MATETQEAQGWDVWSGEPELWFSSPEKGKQIVGRYRQWTVKAKTARFLYFHSNAEINYESTLWLGFELRHLQGLPVVRGPLGFRVQLSFWDRYAGLLRAVSELFYSLAAYAETTP
jgi:hypothetical protein